MFLFKDAVKRLQSELAKKATVNCFDLADVDSVPENSVALIVSDCVSKQWYNGHLLERVKNLPKIGIVQTLPQRLWRGTGLSQGLRANVKITKRGFKTDADESYLSEDIPDGRTIPIFAIDDSTHIQRFYKGNYWTQCVMFPSVLADENERAVEDLSPKWRIERFFALASPTAQEIATELAVHNCEITRDRLAHIDSYPFLKVQGLKTVHVAEVYFGGILKKVNDTAFDFHDGVREILKSKSLALIE